METILEKLPLPLDIIEALLKGSGQLGTVLTAVKAYEQGEWMALKSLQLEPSIIRDYYIQSIDWAHTFSPIMK